jgi:hypothetical protein
MTRSTCRLRTMTPACGLARWHGFGRPPEQVGAGESAVVGRLQELGLSDDVAAVVDRLGASTGGSVEARARLLRGQPAEAVYVLIVEQVGRRPAVTVHHSGEAAADE